MPVIASNAWASTFDSYSCVGMSSDSTLISMPAKGFAASMNHCISFSWSARDSVDRPRSPCPGTALASSMPAHDALGAMRARQATVPEQQSSH